MKKKLALLMAAVMSCAAFLSGCGGGSSSAASSVASASAAVSTSATASGLDEGKLTIGAASDIVTLDPHDQNQTNCQDLFASIGSTMFTRDLDFKLVNDLCVDYTQDSDTQWTFKIREGVVFNNGEELTADDVKYSYDRVSQDSTLVGYTYMKCIVSTEVVDDYTVRVTTDTARPDLPTLLAMASSTILPKDFMEENGIEGYIDSPVTSGRYNLKEWVPDDHYTLVPNPDYYGDDKATWQEVTYRVIPEASTRVSELLAGGVDVIYNVPVNEWTRVGAEGSGTSLVYGDTSQVMLLIVRCTDGWAGSDPKVREAIELAIDKDAICDTLLQGAGVPTRTRVASSVPGFNESLYGSENANLYDPERAKELLAEAGYDESNQLELTLTSPNGRYLMDAEMAQMISAYLEAVGVKVNLELVDSTVLANTFTSKENKDLMLIGLSDGQYDGLYALGNNADPSRAEGQTDYFNDELTELYQSARVEMDETARTEMEQQMQEILAEDRPFIQIAQMSAVFGASDRVTLNPRTDSQIMPDEVTLAQ